MSVSLLVADAADENQISLPGIAPAVPTFTPPAEGEVITSSDTGNTYTVGTLLGEGNFSYVYSCTDTWENDLAVKILKPRGTYEEVRNNAIAELRKLQHLRHPNVTFVHDAFEFRHTFYIVVERCWKPLNQFFADANVDGRVWLRPIARQLLQGVHFLHCNNFAHQDIHGGNVLIAAQKDDLTPNDLVFTFKLGDLGIAKMVTEMDAANTVLADWMRAPESIAPAEFGPMDSRMDIYHCGLLFLQILKGQPLTFTTEQVLAGAPRQMALQLGPPYSFALEKALRRHVDKRTSSALELWRDINTPVQAD